ncbi:flavin reductase family protein [Metallosphaera hakonensis]|uniref:flavin reductase family protein n=1 Tax=Metallosphaera hakonensis TaxID=79601 RepID=UPI0006D27066|nr:flavin reductase family protein [Metallosphaera hakonensis]
MSEELKGLMRRFPLGVAVVTTKWRDKLVGMTVNTFNSLSMSPPLALFLADRTRGNDVLQGKRVFSVNLTDDKDILNTFAVSPVETRFRKMKYELEEGVPVLTEAYAYMILRKVQVIDVGDHSIIVGEVIKTRMVRDADPLVYYDRDYRKIC